jgi:hypothetical protein
MLKCRLMINDHKIYEIIEFLKYLVEINKTKSITAQY